MSTDSLDRINETGTPPDDGKAKLEYRSLYHKHRRKDRRENAINWCFLGFIWICSIGMCLIVATKIIYTIIPSAIYWLNKEQLAELDKFFVDGSIGGLVVGIFKSKILDKEEI